MYDVLLFAGTTEGRELAEFMRQKGVAALACVASDYGGSLLKSEGSVDVRVGRLGEEEIFCLIGESRPKYVVDATHPYAVEASRNISSACRRANAAYIRVRRADSAAGGCAEFEDIDSLVRALDETEGAVFLSTGSKDLKRFAGIKNHGERLFARVLPSVESLELCLEAGLLPSHIICMQGPFSHELNLAMFRYAGAKILVTKESGALGGFEEKLSAARELGMRVFLLKKPSESGDMTLDDVKKIVGSM